MKKKFPIDLFIIFILVISYACFSFSKLGSFDNPNTFEEKKEIILKSNENDIYSKIRFFTGHFFKNMKVYVSLDGENYELLHKTGEVYAFSWNDIEIEGTFKYIRILLDDDTSLGEIALYDNRENLVKLSNIKNGQKVIDEQDVVPDVISYMNSTYFDEIYFARTAYEYANNLKAYEWVHPPLAKLISAIPIKLFKMAPFYYRFMSNLAAVLMIPIIYLFSKAMFKKTKYAIFTSCLLIFDNFHFAQGRIGTTDSILALFIITSYYFMYLYTQNKDKLSKKKIIYLLISGITIGCAIATKWTGLFAGLGLCIIFFIHFFKNYFENKKITKEGLKIILMCILFFIIIPLLIYISCYLLFPNMYYYSTGNINDIINITKQMYNYHSTLTESHDFYSNWYSWLIMYKPVWYYSQLNGSLKATISGIGNPIVWWMGTIGILYLIYLTVKKNKDASFIVIGYFCFLLPYMKISRGMFLYHYYPCFIMTLFGITYLFKKLDEKNKNISIYYLVVVIFFFILFYPVVSGKFVEPDFINRLRWLPSWIF